MAVASAPQLLDLRKAIAYALENSPDFDSLSKHLNIARMEEQTAQARLLPSLDLAATHGLSDANPRITTSPWYSDLNLGLTESLYDNGVGQTNTRIASLGKKQAELHFQEQQNKISLDIATQFLVYSLNVKLLEIQERQFKLVSQQYDLISKNYHQGIRTKNDYLRFKTQVSRSEIDVITARSNLDKSKQELLRLVGQGLKASRESEIDFVPIAFEHIENRIPDPQIELENHLQYQEASLQKEANQLSADIIGRKNLPEWFVSAGVNYGSSNYLGTGQSFEDNDRLSWNALLTVKYNFFDWGIRARDKEVALQRSRIQSNDLDAGLLTLQSSLRQLVISTRQIQKNFDLAKELLSLEKSNIGFIEQEYRNGKVQYLDLITGLNNLSDAEIKFYSAVSDLQTTRYTILYHQGKLYEELLK